jgi:mono/diheme cytochrome c family protein
MSRRSERRLAILLLALLAACAPGESEDAPAAPPPLPPTPAELAGGESLYVSACASCHGVEATGTSQGPPLAHVIYEPSHHGDASFQLAVRGGVRAHHWGFGDMPPQPQVAAEDVAEIVRYVRWVQRQRGIE